MNEKQECPNACIRMEVNNRIVFVLWQTGLFITATTYPHPLIWRLKVWYPGVCRAQLPPSYRSHSSLLPCTTWSQLEYITYNLIHNIETLLSMLIVLFSVYFLICFICYSGNSSLLLLLYVFYPSLFLSYFVLDDRNFRGPALQHNRFICYLECEHPISGTGLSQLPHLSSICLLMSLGKLGP